MNKYLLSSFFGVVFLYIFYYYNFEENRKKRKISQELNTCKKKQKLNDEFKNKVFNILNLNTDKHTDYDFENELIINKNRLNIYEHGKKVAYTNEKIIANISNIFNYYNIENLVDYIKKDKIQYDKFLSDIKSLFDLKNVNELD